MTCVYDTQDLLGTCKSSRGLIHIRKERIQRLWTKQAQSLWDFIYSERLSELGLFSVQGCLTRADLILYWKIFHGKSYITPQFIFAHPQTVTRGHPFKIMVMRANSRFRQRFFTRRYINIWNSLPADVTATNLQPFKRGLADAIPKKLLGYV